LLTLQVFQRATQIAGNDGEIFQACVFGDIPLAFATRWDFVIGADIVYSDDYLAVLMANPVDGLTVPSATRWNGFIGAEQPDGNWSVILRGTNLSDSEDIYSGIVDSFFGVNIRTPQRPREYMLEAKYRY